MRYVRWFVLVCLACAATSAFAADAKQMSVTVKETQVRDKPSYLGKVLGVLSYGDRVTILEQPADAPKGWLKVSGPGNKLQGWVNESALTEKTIVLKAGSENVSQTASTGDVALAGKGFNADVEAQYKEEKQLDYTWVDTMESAEVDPDAIALFLSKGGLNETGGAQ